MSTKNLVPNRIIANPRRVTGLSRRQLLKYTGAAASVAATSAMPLGSALAHMAGSTQTCATSTDLILSAGGGDVQKMSYHDGNFVSSYVVFQVDESGYNFIKQFSDGSQINAGEVIVTNLGSEPVYLATSASTMDTGNPSASSPFSRPINPQQASVVNISNFSDPPVLYTETGKTAGPLVLFQINNGQNIAGMLQAQLEAGAWEAYQYPNGIEYPLWISSRTFLEGPVSLDPWAVTGTKKPSGAPATIDYNICTNLWWLPAGSDAAIHNLHYANFLEVHTQLFGAGRMQKFLQNDQYSTNQTDGYTAYELDLPKGAFFNTGEDGSSFPSMYEEFRMVPPDTNRPFPIMSTDSSLSECQYDNYTASVTSPCFQYQWHQYYADTDCIWVAYEYHQA